MKRIEVAVAIVVRPDSGEVLTSLRQKHQHQAGFWEFPGGKREAGESMLAALKRELNEEVGITIHSANPFYKLEHDYDDKQVCLDFWYVTEFSGEAEGREGQQIRWQRIEELDPDLFPEANKPIIEVLKNRHVN